MIVLVSASTLLGAMPQTGAMPSKGTLLSEEMVRNPWETTGDNFQGAHHQQNRRDTTRETTGDNLEGAHRQPNPQEIMGLRAHIASPTLGKPREITLRAHITSPTLGKPRETTGNDFEGGHHQPNPGETSRSHGK